MDTRKETPPHHPAHGVHLSDNEIEGMLRICFPDNSGAFIIARLPHGQSFNNRIYMINNTQDTTNGYVLKVNGKIFGPAKIENEIACLQIFQRYCPTVPVPQVIAWSTDGCQIVLTDGRKQSLDANITTTITTGQHGWILMTRLPGAPIHPSTLAAEHVPSLSLQLAKLISCWRHNIPRPDRCGNLRMRGEDDRSKGRLQQDEGAEHALGFDIQGIAEIGWDGTSQPIDSLLSYWQVRLSNAMKQLATEDVYAENRQPLLPSIDRFVNETLPDLPIFQNSSEQEGGFVFTHTDLSPRNVLIVGSPPQISGIVDFEFSGFFPWTKDYTGYSIVSDEQDEEGWPVLMHNQILQHLEDVGVVTPLRLKRTREWKDLIGLLQLETYIAPWWLSTGGASSEELERDLKDARGKVEDALLSLAGAY